MTRPNCLFEFRADTTRIIDAIHYMAQQHPGRAWDAATGAIVFTTVSDAMLCRMMGDKFGITYVGRMVMQ